MISNKPPYNHAVDVVDTHAGEGNLEQHEKEPGKKPHQCQQSTMSPEHRDSIALQLPTFTSMKSSLYRSYLVVNFSLSDHTALIYSYLLLQVSSSVNCTKVRLNGKKKE